jgi:hypothetical protein
MIHANSLWTASDAVDSGDGSDEETISSHFNALLGDGASRLSKGNGVSPPHSDEDVKMLSSSDSDEADDTNDSIELDDGDDVDWDAFDVEGKGSRTKSPPRKRSKIWSQETQSLSQKKDRQAKDLIIRNICSTFMRLSFGHGQHSKDDNILLRALSLAIMSQEVRDKKLGRAMTRVAGISQEQQERTFRMLETQNKGGIAVSGAIVPVRASAKTGRFASLETTLEKIVEYFHNLSPLVEVDKSRPDNLTGRYGFQVAGKVKKLTCRRRLSRGTKQELVDELKGTPFYKGLLAEIGRVSINDSKLQSCICYCIKPKSISECACGICTEFKLAIEAWHVQREIWHKKHKCRCAGCSSHKKEVYFNCSRSVSAFFDAVLCKKVAYPHLILPHFNSATDPSAVPHFRSCSLIIARGYFSFIW